MDPFTAIPKEPIIYAQGTPSRSYTAILRKEGDIWKLVRIQFPDGVGQ